VLFRCGIAISQLYLLTFFIEIHFNVKPTGLERHGGKMMGATAKKCSNTAFIQGSHSFT